MSFDAALCVETATSSGKFSLDRMVGFNRTSPEAHVVLCCSGIKNRNSPRKLQFQHLEQLRTTYALITVQVDPNILVKQNFLEEVSILTPGAVRTSCNSGDVWVDPNIFDENKLHRGNCNFNTWSST